MAVDMFLKIDDIKGESIDIKHGNEIQVLSWTWGLTQSGTTHDGPGAGAGKVNVQDLTVTKYIDTSTPNLIKACCKGTHFKQAMLTVRKAGDKPLEYLTISLHDLIITALTTGGSGGEDRITEHVTLNFAQMEVIYTPQTGTGGGGGSIPVAWNIPKNVDKLG